MTFLTLQRITYEAGANVYRYQTGCLMLDRKSLRLCNLEWPSGSVYVAANHYSEQNNRCHLETLPGQTWVGHSLNYLLRQAHHPAHQPAPPDCPSDHDVSFLAQAHILRMPLPASVRTGSDRDMTASTTKASIGRYSTAFR